MSEYIVPNLEKEENTGLNIHSMYCRYHYDCLQRNYKILNLDDFTVHIKFVQNKITSIENKLKNLAAQTSNFNLISIRNKLDKLQFLAKNPNYEIEFIIPSLIQIERELCDL